MNQVQDDCLSSTDDLLLLPPVDDELCSSQCPEDDEYNYFSDDFGEVINEYFEVQQLKNYMNERDIHEIESPSTQRWTDADQRQMRTVFRVNASSKKMWEQAKVEFLTIKERMCTLLHLSKQREDEVNFEMLVDYFIGEDSELGKFFQNKLQISAETYMQFMITYCIQCAYSVSSSSIYSDVSPLKDSVIMPQNEYNELWNKISKMEQKGEQSVGTGRRGVCLWEQLEEKVNIVLRKISVEDVRTKLSLAVDDDKIWLNATIKSLNDTFSLKITRHVKDNRMGMVLHTAVSTGLLIPVACTFERVKENTQSCYQRIFTRLFGRNGDVDLRNVDVHSDRGYSLPSVVFEFLIASGANVVCTVKRFLLCWPFNYGPKHKENDPRTHIDEFGAPTLYVKMVNLPKRVLAGAFRNGSGSVSTIVSSLHHGFEWEGIPYHEASKLSISYDNNYTSLKSFFFQQVPMLGGVKDIPIFQNNHLVDHNVPISPLEWDEKEKELLLDMLERTIDPLTIVQGSADWHYLRKFSLTSSQTFESFKVAFPDFAQNEHWKYLARYVYGDGAHRILCPELDAIEEDNQQHVPAEEDVQIRPLPEHIANLAALILVDEGNYTNSQHSALIIIQESINNNKIISEEDASTQVAALTKNQKVAIKEFLMTSRFNEAQRGTYSDKSLQRWFTYNNAAREYAFLKAGVLKSMIKAKGLKVNKGRSSIDDMIKILSGEVSQQIGTTVLVSDHNARQKAIRAVLTNSFQKPLKGEARENCTLGHQLEIPILKSWAEAIKDRYYPGPNIRLLHAYKVGLAAKKNEPAVKDSLDFHLHIVDVENQELKKYGFEAKGRVTARTAQMEDDYVMDRARDVHIQIDSMDVYKNIASPKERWQILHHAYVYDYDEVVHAVGDSQGELIESTIVTFDDDIMLHYKRVLEDLTNISLRWAYYNTTSPAVDIPQEIKDVAIHVKAINGIESLQSAVNLWKEMTNTPLPMPPLARIIPSMHANWNKTKGGSDVTTKLMDKNLAPLPFTNPETVAVNRLISILFVMIHRIHHAFTAKSHLPYPYH